jgi:Arc/MetJ family transcription regulator
MMSRTQITLDSELQKRAQQHAGEMGISFAEYIRRLVARDLSRAERKASIECIFDLGSSGGSNIAQEKDTMLAAAFDAANPGGNDDRRIARP